MDLLTNEEVRRYLDVDATDAPADEWLAVAIAGVSQEAERITGRTYPATDPDTPAARVFPHNGDTLLRIDDCRDVTQLRASADPQISETWITLDEVLWIAEPLDRDVKTLVRFLQAPDTLPARNVGWVFGGAQARSDRTLWPHEARTQSQLFMGIEVTAKWGAGTVPDNVKLACCVWVQALHRRDVAFFGRDFDDRARASMGKIPDDVAAILEGQEDARSNIAAV